jgi:uncharacterized protein YndB with AHSA1/START domain
MKTLKRILVVIAIIVAIPLIAALFVSSEYAVEKEVVVNKPLKDVFDYVKYLKNQDQYSKWAQMDPAMKKEFRGNDGEPGFVSAWESKNEEVGKGEQEIKKIVDYARIEYELRFKEPFESTEEAYMTTEPMGESQTRVKWGFKGKMPYPFNLMGAFMNVEDMIGKDLETGLVNLKVMLEK